MTIEDRLHFNLQNFLMTYQLYNTQDINKQIPFHNKISYQSMSEIKAIIGN